MQHKTFRFVLYGTAIGISLSLAGCADSLRAKQKAVSTVMPENPPADVTSITPLLQLMSALPSEDPATQAQTLQSAKEAASLSPTTSNRLRYALALATPGHGGSDAVAAQRQLAELLAKPETLLPAERLLALVALHDLDHHMVLQAENKRLREEAPREGRDKLQAINKRLAAESDDNARLRKALDEARAKLEAVTHIERSINDRGVGTPTP